VAFESADGRVAATFTVQADNDSRLETVRFARFAERALDPIGSVVGDVHGEWKGAEFVETMLKQWRHIDPGELDWELIRQSGRKKKFGIF
jgi:hypothetical protein